VLAASSNTLACSLNGRELSRANRQRAPPHL
jgi:hypothetical protein